MELSGLGKKDVLSAGDEDCFIGLVDRHDHHRQANPGDGHGSKASVEPHSIVPGPDEGQTGDVALPGSLRRRSNICRDSRGINFEIITELHRPDKRARGVRQEVETSGGGRPKRA
jgi:hypothetical protein